MDGILQLDLQGNDAFVKNFNALEVEIASLVVDLHYFHAGLLPQTRSRQRYQKRRYCSMKLSCFFCSIFISRWISYIVWVTISSASMSKVERRKARVVDLECSS